MKLKKLIQTLHKEQSIHEKMLNTKRDEQRFIALGDATTLLKNAEKLTDLVDEARTLESQRMQLTQELSAELNLEKKQPTLREIIQALPDDKSTELSEARDTLKSTIYQLQEINQANSIMLERAAQTFQTEFSRAAQQVQSGVYSKNGSRPQNQTVRGGLNVRV